MRSQETESTDTDASDLAQRAIDGIREMIVRQELAAGEKVRQVDLAAKLGLSRSPLREALRSLEADGVVSYQPNRGYVVTRLSPEELVQLYRMRELLETELIMSLRAPSKSELKQLRASNAEMRKAIKDASGREILSANRRFHWQMFALSPLSLVRREVERLWSLSEQYRAAYLSLPDTRQRVVGEHEAMLDALANGDLKALLRLQNAHRMASERAVLAWFGAHGA